MSRHLLFCAPLALLAACSGRDLGNEWFPLRVGDEQTMSVSYQMDDPPIMDVLGIKASEAHQIADPHLGVQKVDDDTTNLGRLVERYLQKVSKASKKSAPTVRAPAMQPEPATMSLF